MIGLRRTSTQHQPRHDDLVASVEGVAVAVACSATPTVTVGELATKWHWFSEAEPLRRNGSNDLGEPKELAVRLEGTYERRL